jgi:hypothetical protein
MPVDVELVVDPEEGSSESLRRAAARKLRIVVGRIALVRVRYRAIDARRSPRLHVTATVFVRGEEIPPTEVLSPPRLKRPTRKGPPVVVVGAGPAGLFAALRLAEHGVPAVVLDRGKPVQARRRDIAALNKRGIVDEESNYCFGEGGAGTYSDGKLYTRSDKRGPVGGVLRTLVAHGAPPDILIDARPHIGSNRLPKVVTRIRQTLASGGLPLRFEARVLDLFCERGRVRGVRLSGGEEIEASAVVMATGHSARDVFEMLARAGARLEAKAFAAGIRVEHPQPLIDAVQYGRYAGHPMLPPASYRLAATVDGRGVFSFCMCPGGWIVPATTEPDAIVVNGMSLSRRGSLFANSGIVVAIEPPDLSPLGYDGVFGGVRFQRDIERHAFELGGGAQTAPAQRIADFLAGRASGTLPKSSYRPGLRAAPLHRELPEILVGRLRVALASFARMMRGYDTEEAVAVGVESRTSSPIRVVRDRGTLENPTLGGLYPCGEGAGYAGGIASAAIDGIRVAERISAALPP